MIISQNRNQQTFSSLKLTRDALYASSRVNYDLNRDYGKIRRLADDVDVVIRKKILQDRVNDAHTDLVIKVCKKLPEPKNKFERIKNFLIKPFLPSKKAVAGWNYGFYDTPIKVVERLKAELLSFTR